MLWFCTAVELPVVATAVCLLLVVYRALEAEQDRVMVASQHKERLLSEYINADRKQLIGVLSHEIRNRLDILTNLMDNNAAHASQDNTPVMQQVQGTHANIVMVSTMLGVDCSDATEHVCCIGFAASGLEDTVQAVVQKKLLQASPVLEAFGEPPLSQPGCQYWTPCRQRMYTAQQ